MKKPTILFAAMLLSHAAIGQNQPSQPYLASDAEHAFSEAFAKQCFGVGNNSTGAKDFLSNELPFSFELGNQSSRDFMKGWAFSNRDSALNDRIIHHCRWTKPDGSFEVKAKLTEFKNHSAVEWKLWFKNTGKDNSPVVHNVKTLDMLLRSKNAPGTVFLNCNKGSSWSIYDYMPVRQMIEPKQPYHMESNGGRCSREFLPFWNLDCEGYGFVTALGWTGDWKANFSLPEWGKTAMSAGMLHLETYLKPGEEIGGPSVCVLYWEGKDAQRGNNLFRRYMNDLIVPKWNGKAPSISAVMGGAYSLEGVNEDNQKRAVREVAGTGAEVYWIDAGWYGNGTNGSWWTGRGNWYEEKTKFPSGMRAISDEIHKNRMKFMLWFEPEWVFRGTEIAVQHPEFIIWNKNEETGMFNLGDPEGLKYITDLISKKLIDWDVDIFRTDYNVDPAPYWQLADEPGRRGITEMRYIESLYKFWDGLKAQKPDILIDNCASGGRRIDYETCKRSIPMWRSDFYCGVREDLWVGSQNESYGLNMYLPFNSNGYGITGDKYKDRSIANGNVAVGLFGNHKDGSPVLFYLDMKDDPHTPIDIPKERIKSFFGDLKQYNYLMSADYYPLTEFSLSDKVWMVLQYDSPEKGEGCVLCFRRPNAPYSNAEFCLQAVDLKATYKLKYLDSGKESVVKGKQLNKLPVRLNRGESVVIKYVKQKNKSQ
jgi:alpha-galactosidase